VRRPIQPGTRHHVNHSVLLPDQGPGVRSTVVCGNQYPGGAVDGYFPGTAVQVGDQQSVLQVVDGQQLFSQVVGQRRYTQQRIADYIDVNPGGCFDFRAAGLGHEQLFSLTIAWPRRFNACMYIYSASVTGVHQVIPGRKTKRLVMQVKRAGAKGFKIVGSTCVGQDLQLRGAHCREAFAGHAGNNFISEALVSTGGIDLLVSEFNCTLPGLEPICEQFLVPQICLDDVAKKANADYVRYDSNDAADMAAKIMQAALGSYTQRRGKVQVDIPGHGYDDAVTGVSEKSLKKFLGGTFKPLIDLIAGGKIKGAAAVVGCSNLTAKGHDVFTVGLTKELIKRDIIVLSAGCTSGGLENVGLTSPASAELAGDNLKEICRALGIPPVLNFGPCLAIGRLEIVAAELARALNIDIPQLPLVLSAPQWLEEQALADGAFGLALGLPLHLAIPPFVTGSRLVSKMLNEDMEQLTGGKVILEGEIVPAAEKLAGIIEQKRKALGL